MSTGFLSSPKEMELPYTLADRYRLVSHLAKGGMSDVYLAVDLALGRRVAVKILPRSHSEDESFVRRFRREAQSAANLNHPNIVGIYDWGEAEGAYFMVMELVEGDCLSDITREGRPIPAHRAMEIARQVVLALSTAHRLGVIHRDVKPGNVMLDADGAVKVADFGIARAWNHATELTQTGSVIGTATYFSPEQAQGRPADMRSDIYSLGVVLYEMLVGRPPFQGETPMSVAYQHVSTEVAPPSSRNPEIPPELDVIVLRALSKDPDSRYQDTEPLLQDLEAWLRGDEIPGMVMESPVVGQPSPEQSQVVVRKAVPPLPGRRGARGGGRLLSQSYYPHMEERRSAPLPFVMGVLVLLAALAGLSWVVWNLLQAPAPQPATVTVAIPDVVGRWEADALTSIQDSELTVQVIRESSQEMPEGRVIATDPPAGDRVESRTEVVVVVSSGLEQFDIPLVIGQTQGTAESLLLAQGFVVGVIEYVEDSGRQVGTVVDQDPLPGPLLPAGTPIDLIVATGPGLLVVPDVVGLPGSEALSVLAQSGLRWVETVESSDSVPAGQVLRTEPGAGGGIAPTGQVMVVISEGSATGPDPGSSVVPDVTGLPSSEALVVLAQSGLRWVETVESSDSVPAGQVVRTEPGAGDRAEAGLVVVLVVSDGPGLLVVPDVTGLSSDEAQAALAEVGLSVIESTEVSDSVPAGQVVRTEPGAGETAEAGLVVVLVVSDGPGLLVVPDVTGLSSDEAQAALAEVGLSVIESTEVSDSVPAGQVVRTEPGAGESAQSATPVLVVISAGPGAEDATTTTEAAPEG